MPAWWAATPSQHRGTPRGRGRAPAGRRRGCRRASCRRCARSRRARSVLVSRTPDAHQLVDRRLAAVAAEHEHDRRQPVRGRRSSATTWSAGRPPQPHVPWPSCAGPRSVTRLCVRGALQHHARRGSGTPPRACAAASRRAPCGPPPLLPGTEGRVDAVVDVVVVAQRHGAVLLDHDLAAVADLVAASRRTPRRC